MGLAVEEQGGPAPGFAVPDAIPVAMVRVPREASHHHSSRRVATLVLEADCASWNPSPRWVAVMTQAAKCWGLHCHVEVATLPVPESWRPPHFQGPENGCHGAGARVCQFGLWHDGD